MVSSGRLLCQVCRLLWSFWYLNPCICLIYLMHFYFGVMCPYLCSYHVNKTEFIHKYKLIYILKSPLPVLHLYNCAELTSCTFISSLQFNLYSSFFVRRNWVPGTREIYGENWHILLWVFAGSFWVLNIFLLKYL